MYRVACLLLVIATVLSPAAATATTVSPDGSSDPPPGNGTGTEPTTTSTPTTPDGTVIASDGTFGGFTLGAAILAVLVAGSYRYLRG